MCDYSLHGVKSRPAKVGDKLVTATFPGTETRGFSAIGEPNVAVCLLPGTELAFEKDVVVDRSYFLFLLVGNSYPSTARFRRVNENEEHIHHDALEFPDGRIMTLTRLRVGQRATVLQLPAQPKVTVHHGSTEISDGQPAHNETI